ncbi:MAG: FAD-dependent oxidoreductase [Candidatus Latescibacteria bacterium]|nr:FAD-dependent oxidoreductase [Candidatus Latescibacterota bacterium]
MTELRADLIIAGGGLGGCAAALAACRSGLRVVMTEETDWIGGQLTQQAVPPDEHPWIESFGGTQAYRELRTRIRDFYRRNYPLTPEARGRWNLNPGSGSVSRLCCEPRVALAALNEMLAPFTSGARLTVLPHHRPISAETEGDAVKAITVRSLLTGDEVVLTAPLFIDATELGDLLPLTGTEFVTGFESQSETGEPHAPAGAQPQNMQAFTCCFAVDHVEGEDHTLEKPRDYDFWQTYVPDLTPPWPGRLLDWAYTHPITLEPRILPFDPTCGPPGDRGFWTYRRIADRGNFVPGTYPGDICLINWPHNDYWLGNLCEVSAEEAARHLERAKQLSLSMLHWMQTEAPRPDGGVGWPGLRLRRDVVGTEDGLAKYPYVREARRIRAEFTVLEQHVGTEARMALTDQGREEVQAESFFDSVGVGSYRIDLHPSSGGDNYIDISSLPFQIPLGCLLPRRVTNLLAGAKNIGVTHITNGCYRLHPVEWNVGEAAGALAAFCLHRKVLPTQVRNTPDLLRDFQREIERQGIEIAWPRVTPR